MGTISDISDRQETDIEVVTLPEHATGIYERQISTVDGGAMTSLGGAAKSIRVYHDNDTHGSYVIQVDGENEMRIERRSKSAMHVSFMRKDGAVYFERLIVLEVGASVRIEDTGGRPMTFRRFRHPECLLREMFDRLNTP